MAIDPRALVGTPFRLHGRDARGLDCVGVVAATFGIMDAPRGYALRTDDPARLHDGLRKAGFREAERAVGNVVVLRAGPLQLHLAIRTARGFVHADAGLRRVVETPGEPGWPRVSEWRKD